MTQNPKTCSTGSMLTYSLGECANSLVMNGIFGFAMLFYTKSLGLDPTWAGLAMSVSVFWEAITEPVMGHISDNTRSRWGRRHPYMLIGGLLMALCSYLIWTVPGFCRGSQMTIFWYLVSINLLLRTGLTMFFIPYMALGFEMCTDYQGRSRLQGIRQIFNMAANFAGPAMAWVFFFGGKSNAQATTIEANYHHMGGTFATATAIFVILVCVFTFRWREDSSNAPRDSQHGWLRDFFTDMKEILADPNPRWVFTFIFIVCAGMVIVSSLQMFVYDDFMQFPAWQKSIAHGSTMVGMALGALVSMGLTKRFDKKGAVLIGGAISITGNVMLAVLFLTGIIKPDATLAIGGVTLPLALILFVIFHASYWFGNGIMLPVSTAMMADVSEVRRLKTGEVKDGGYSSVFSLAMRMAISFSLIVAGWCLSGIGYQVPKDGRAVTQTPQAIWNLGMVTFVIGAAICLLSLLAIRLYPITRERLERFRGGEGSSI
jgi:GPH family glycoside/pentoside/hexuronide:cation symporter